MKQGDGETGGRFCRSTKILWNDRTVPLFHPLSLYVYLN